MYVEVIKRPQYVVAGQPEKGVQSVPPPLSIVEGCKYDFSVVAAMAGLKFAFHVPTYRQQDWFAQWGWFPSRSTVNDLMNYAVDTIGPLYQQMWQLLLSQPILLGDDTTLCVLLRDGLDEEDLAKLSTRSRFRQALDQGLPPPHSGLPGSAISYAWLYTGLDGLAPYNVFHWSLTHRNAVIDGHLATYRGIFVGDACGAIARLQQRSGGRIVHASCNMHARREFIQAESNDPILASQAISFYRQLYDVEERGKTLDAAAPPVARSRRGADLEPHATLVGRRCGEAGTAPQQDRRSAGLSTEPVVGTDSVPRRPENSDRQCPIGTDHSALDGGSQQLAVLGASQSSSGALAVVQRRQQCASASSDDRRLPGGCVAQTGRCPAEPSCGPRTRFAVPGRTSARPLGLGASSVRASGSRRRSADGLRGQASAACEGPDAGPRQQSRPVAAAPYRCPFSSPPYHPRSRAMPNSDALTKPVGAAHGKPPRNASEKRGQAPWRQRQGLVNNFLRHGASLRFSGRTFRVFPEHNPLSAGNQAPTRPICHFHASYGWVVFAFVGGVGMSGGSLARRSMVAASIAARSLSWGSRQELGSAER